MMKGRHAGLAFMVATLWVAAAWSYPDRIWKSIGLSQAPLALQIHPKERFLYVLSSESNSLITIDTFLSKQVSDVPVSGVPRSLAFNGDASLLYMVTDQVDRILSYDLTTPSLPTFKETITVANASATFDQILFSPVNDGKLFLLSQSSDKVFVYSVLTGVMESIDPLMDAVSISLAQINRLLVLSSQGVVKVYSTTSLSNQGNSVDFGTLSSSSNFSHAVAVRSNAGNYGFLTRQNNPGEVWLLNMNQNLNFFSFGSIQVGANPIASIGMNVFRPQDGSGSDYLFVANTTDQSLSVVNASAIGGGSLSPLAMIDAVANVTKEGLAAAPIDGYLYALNSVQKSVTILSDQPLLSVTDYQEQVSSESTTSATVSSSRAGQLSLVLYSPEANESVQALGVELATTFLDANIGKTLSYSTQNLEEGSNILGFFIKTGDYVGRTAVEVVKDTVPLPPKNFKLSFGHEKIFVRWDRSPEKDISHYLLYFGESDADGGAAGFVSPIEIPQRDGGGLSFILTPIPNGTTLYMRMAAVDQTGNVSEFTQTLSETAQETVGILGLSMERGGCFASNPAALLWIVVFFFGGMLMRIKEFRKSISVILVLLPLSSAQAFTYSLGVGVGWWVPSDPIFRDFLGKQGNEVYTMQTGIGTKYFRFCFDTSLLSESSALRGVQTGRESGERQNLFGLSFQPGLEASTGKSFFVSPFFRLSHRFQYFSLKEPTQKVDGLKQLTYLSGGVRFVFDRLLSTNDPQEMLGIRHIYLELASSYSRQWTKGLSFEGWVFTPSLGLDF